MLKLKPQYFGCLMWRARLLEKTLMLERLKTGGEGDDRGWDGWMASPTQLDGHEFEQAPGVGDRQGSLPCCSPWGRKESDATEPLNWTDCYILCQIRAGLVAPSTTSSHTSSSIRLWLPLIFVVLIDWLDFYFFFLILKTACSDTSNFHLVCWKYNSCTLLAYCS